MLPSAAVGMRTTESLFNMAVSFSGVPSVGVSWRLANMVYVAPNPVVLVTANRKNWDKYSLFL